MEHEIELDDENEEYEIVLNDEDGKKTDEIPEVIVDALKDVTSLICVLRCSVHSLQLAVLDSFKLFPNDAKKVIAHVRSVIKNLSSSTYSEYISEYNLKRISLDTVTRWNSLYDMITQILSMRNKFQQLYSLLNEREMQKELEKIFISPSEFEFLEQFKETYKLAYELTLILQHSTLQSVCNKSLNLMNTNIDHNIIFLADFYIMWNKYMQKVKMLDR